MTAKYDKLDFFRQGIFHATKAQFTMLLHEGYSLQDISTVAQSIHLSVTSALQMAGAEAVIQLGQPMPMQMPQPSQPPPEGDGSEENPFEP